MPYGFEINLFHAVRRDAVDRSFLHDKLNESKTKIIKELDKLKGQGMVWKIYNGIDDEEYVFDIDNEESEEFISYYKKYDQEGRESCLAYYLEPDDENLNDLNSISKVVIEKVKLLVPLYNLLAFRIKY